MANSALYDKPLYVSHTFSSRVSEEGVFWSFDTWLHWARLGFDLRMDFFSISWCGIIIIYT